MRGLVRESGKEEMQAGEWGGGGGGVVGAGASLEGRELEWGMSKKYAR